MYTANGKNADTPETVSVEFYVGQKWTAKQLFFNGTKGGEKMSNTFTSVSTATKLRLSIDGTNGWAFWRIRFGGITILENLNEQFYGDRHPAYITGTRFWLDGDSESTGNKIIPASIEIDIQCT